MFRRHRGIDIGGGSVDRKAVVFAASHPLLKLNERKQDLTGRAPRRESFDNHRPSD